MMRQFGQSIAAHAHQTGNNRCLLILFDRSSVWINAHFYDYGLWPLKTRIVSLSQKSGIIKQRNFV